MPLSAETPQYRDLSGWVASRILEALRSGDLNPGERLIEREVAKQLGVSRAPVRDGIHRLEQLGVIERSDPRGVKLKSWTDQDVANILLILDALIVLSVGLAAERLSEIDLVELEGIVAQTESAVARGSVDVREQLTLDLGFHAIVARASGNGRLIQLIETLSLPLELHQLDFLRRAGRKYSLTSHRELLDALRNHDAGAAVACASRHAQEARSAILIALEASQPAPARQRIVNDSIDPAGSRLKLSKR